MRSASRLLLSAAAVLFVSACDVTPTATDVVSNRASASENAPIYIVTFRDGVTDVEGAANQLAHDNAFMLRFVRGNAARGFSAVIPPSRLAAIIADPRVLLVEKDGPVHLIDPIQSAGKSAGGGTTTPATQVTPWGITRVGGSADGTGKTAWIIDTGLDLSNTDLNTSKSCHKNFVTTGTNSAQDGNGHGTHVAGTVAAKNNTVGVVGVAANAYVCAVRVLDNTGNGTWESVINGVNYVAANASSGNVANMSLTGAGANATLEKAITDAAAKGIRFALAAGNDGSFAANYTPARLNAANVYTVSAIGTDNCLTTWSNWGNPPVDFAAPGNGIVSLKVGGGTTTMSGTSMAAPHVAGILLLGSIRADGNACSDRDGTADAIAHR